MSLLGSALVGACSVVGIRSGSEQAPYQVIERVGGTVEVRRYPERLAAEAVVEGADERAARNQAFGLLFAYISGANRSRAEIAMTVPVAVDQRSETIAMTSPVGTKATPDGRYAMRFFLPASYTPATAPAPTDPRVQIVSLPEATVAALRFSYRPIPDMCRPGNRSCSSCSKGPRGARSKRRSRCSTIRPGPCPSCAATRSRSPSRRSRRAEPGPAARGA